MIADDWWTTLFPRDVGDEVVGEVESLATQGNKVERAAGLAIRALHHARRGEWRTALGLVTGLEPWAWSHPWVASCAELARGLILSESGLERQRPARAAFHRSVRGARIMHDEWLRMRALTGFAQALVSTHRKRAIRIGEQLWHQAQENEDRLGLSRLGVLLAYWQVMDCEPESIPALLHRAATHVIGARSRTDLCLLYSRIHWVALDDLDGAAEWTREAKVLAEALDDRLLDLRVAASMVELSSARRDSIGTFRETRRVTDAAMRCVREAAFTDAIGTVVEDCSRVVALASITLRRIAEEHGEFAVEAMLGDMLEIVDSFRCTRLRELLRYHVDTTPARRAEAAVWRAGPPDVDAAFEPDGARRRPEDAPVRGLPHRATMNTDAADTAVEGADATADERAMKDLYAARAEPFDLGRWNGTLFLHLAFVGDDLMVLPAQVRGAAMIVEGTKSGFPAVAGVAPRIETLVRRQGELLERVLSTSEPMTADTLERLCPLTQLYRELAAAIELPELLRHLEGRAGDLGARDLVLIPSGPLLQLPLHAAVVDDHRTRWCEVMRTMRYAPSIEVLRLQETAGREPEGGDPRLLIFANPEAEGYPYLPGVRAEVHGLIETLRNTGGSWRIHGNGADPDHRATLESFRRWHASADLLWLAGHGESAARIGGRGSGLHLCDGTVGAAELFQSAYDFSPVELVVVSACLLGDVRAIDRADGAIEEFATILALRGCRRMVTALWQIEDDSAAAFGSMLLHHLLALPRVPGGPRNGYARALRRAIEDLRRHDRGRFDHEFYWAPYWLWGLG